MCSCVACGFWELTKICSELHPWIFIQGINFRISRAYASVELMGQKICMDSTSWECCWFYMERGLNVRLCSLVYQQCSRSSTKYFLCPALRNTGTAVSTATKHEVCFGVWERLLSQRQPSRSHTQYEVFCSETTPLLSCPGFYCACRSRWANFSAIIIILDENEEIRSCLQCDTQLVFLTRRLVIRLTWLCLIHISRWLFKVSPQCLVFFMFCFTPKQCCVNQWLRCEFSVITASASMSEHHCRLQWNTLLAPNMSLDTHFISLAGIYHV